jgi:uroporphyrinogen decarboxylase
MTSRERIRKLLDRKPVDRIPNGLGGCETAGLHMLAYNKLKAILRIESSETRLDTFMCNAVMELEVLEAMQGDIVLLASPLMCSSNFWGSDIKSEWKKQMLWDQSFMVPKTETFVTEANGTIWWGNSKCPPDGIFFDHVPDEVNDTQSYAIPIPSPDDFNPLNDISDNKLRALEEQARWLFENTNYSINCGETIQDLQICPMPMTEWWMLMIEQPHIVHEYLSKACEAGLSQLKLLDQAIGKYTDILSIAHDLGDMRGVTMGPDLWREIYKPHYKRLFTQWHEITNMKINLHSCGSIVNILPDFIECELDILNPVQISARKMDPENLITKFGDKLIFYGGCFDVIQNPPGTPDEAVFESVRKNIMTLSKNGGYIFAGVHNIPGDTPQSHLKAMLDAYNNCNAL